ncbi:hypothetical protein L596_016315 [Steinernema carpocapsae]|uniref:Uncharacterized protein n=1 Tax=Steinernema carpocapsae TaxID=34508 RepID=A0A4U5NIP9_STECR|nr:hypothetical protein L596_016315 [Steinernema carpocapsae]
MFNISDSEDGTSRRAAVYFMDFKLPRPVGRQDQKLDAVTDEICLELTDVWKRDNKHSAVHFMDFELWDRSVISSEFMKSELHTSEELQRQNLSTRSDPFQTLVISSISRKMQIPESVVSRLPDIDSPKQTPISESGDHVLVFVLEKCTRKTSEFSRQTFQGVRNLTLRKCCSLTKLMTMKLDL